MGTIEERVLEVARYVIETKSTVRQAGKRFNTCKSSIWIDLTSRLEKYYPELVPEVQKVLGYNKFMRSYRGGRALREKWRKENERHSCV